MIEELNQVVLTVDLPEHGLVRGDIGTIVLPHGEAGYQVEFVALDGETIAIASLSTSQVRPIGPLQSHRLVRLKRCHRTWPAAGFGKPSPRVHRWIRENLAGVGADVDSF